jgi:hypothetical protein
VVDYLRVMFPPLNLPESAQRLKTEGERPFIFCQLRKKFLVLTPEEWVRQNLVSYLNRDLGYPLSLMKIEREVKGGTRTKRADLVICNNNGKAHILVECKAPTEKLTKETFFQLGRYNRHIEASLLLITNGMEHYCCHITQENEFEFLDGIPPSTTKSTQH